MNANNAIELNMLYFMVFFLSFFLSRKHNTIDNLTAIAVFPVQRRKTMYTHIDTGHPFDHYTIPQNIYILGEYIVAF